MKLYLKILRFITPYWKAILFAVLLTVTYVVFNNISLWVIVTFIQQIFDPGYVDGVGKALTTMTDDVGFYQQINGWIEGIIVQETKGETLIAVCIVILIAFIVKNITIYSKRVILDFVEMKIVINFRKELQKKMLQLPITYLDNRHSGELTSVVFNDVNGIKTVLANTFGRLILSPLQIITNIFLMFIISWKLSAITFIVVPISTFVIVKIGQSMRRRSRKVYKQIADVVSTFQEAITAARIVKAFTNENKEMVKFNKTNDTYFQRQFRANRLKFASSPINEVLLIFMLVFLLWYGGNLVFANDGLRAEDFLRFLTFLFTMFQPIKELAGVNNVLQSGFAAAERIFEVLDEPDEKYNHSGKVLEQFKQKIEFKNVKFKYKKDGPYVINNVSLTINQGEMVAFVGHSGSGKTTLINLLPRFYQIESGQIILDGVESSAYNLHSLRNQMSVVTQDTILFNDTIRANIAYGRDGVSEEEIIEAAKNANAWEFIEKMDNGLDTHIGEKGTRLSGGQKQRISIARAIIKNPSILILDEATSALDTESERLVQQAIDNLLESRTVLVIAHRLSTITNADKIAVFEEGKITAVGTHSELLNTSTLYKKLSQNQFIENGE